MVTLVFKVFLKALDARPISCVVCEYDKELRAGLSRTPTKQIARTRGLVLPRPHPCSVRWSHGITLLDFEGSKKRNCKVRALQAPKPCNLKTRRRPRNRLSIKSLGVLHGDLVMARPYACACGLKSKSNLTGLTCDLEASPADYLERPK
jgi:hypothetical protein